MSVLCFRYSPAGVLARQKRQRFRETKTPQIGISKAVIIVGIAMRMRTVGLLGEVSGTLILCYALDIY